MRSFGRWLLWMLLAGVALQLFFVLRIALMLVIDPQSTAFMRSEAWRVATESLTTADKEWRWSSQWVDYEDISPNLKRAVMASEDAGFVEHGVHPGEGLLRVGHFGSLRFDGCVVVVRWRRVGAGRG